MRKTLYDILNLEIDASPADIESAYQRTLLACSDNGQPPANEEKLARYLAAKEAYQVLSTPLRRSLYDEKLIMQEQNYTRAEAASMSWLRMTIIGFAIVILAGLTYNYKLELKKQERALAEIKRHEQEAIIRQEEIKLEAEKARLESERIEAEKIALDERLRLQKQFREDNYQFAKDQERLERENQQKEREKRAEQRADEQRIRRESVTPTPRPLYIFAR